MDECLINSKQQHKILSVVVIVYVQGIVKMILNILLLTNILPFNAKHIFFYLTQYFIPIDITTKIDCMMTMTCLNLFILVSSKRGEFELLIHELIANFAAFDVNVQCILFSITREDKLFITSYICITFMHKRKGKHQPKEETEIINIMLDPNKDMDATR